MSFMAAIRLGLRGLRGGLKGFRIFIACIALGVAAIAGVGSFASALVNGLESEGAAILGADLSFQLMHREATPDEYAALARQGTLSVLATTRAMARTTAGDAALAEVKAIDPAAYPLYGTLVTEPSAGVALLDGPAALVESALMARLNLAVGDEVLLGDTRLKITGVITSEPDKLAGGIGFGPRLMVSLDNFRLSGLIQPGSLIKWHYQLRASPAQQNAPGLEAIENGVRAALPEAGFDIRSRLNASPQVERQVARFAQFLTLVGLAALLIGGVGVASAVSNHLDRRRDDIATLKTLGASGGFIALSELTQIMSFALIGTALGLALGASLPFAVVALAGSLIPIPVAAVLAPKDLALAAGFGLLVALAFSVLPLSRARAITVSALYRDRISPPAIAFRPLDGVFLILSFGALAALAYGTASDGGIALAFLASASVLFIVLMLIGRIIVWLARLCPRPKASWARMALGNIHRKGNPTVQVVLALGLGLTLVVMIVLTDAAFRKQLTSILPDKAPAFFFADIPVRQGEAFDALVSALAPDAVITRVPMLRGRIVMVNGVPAEQVKAADNVAWTLSGDRGITYSDVPPPGATLTAGQWWPKDHAGTNLVSLDERVAHGLNLKIGDTITVNVLGRNLTATVHNLRHIQWESMGINFLLVFSPNMFQGAPHTSLATLALPKSAGAESEIAIVRAVAQNFPSVSSVRVKEALEAVDGIGRQIAFGIRLASLVTLAAAILVLGGALSAGIRARLYDAVILKTLGAQRRWLIGVALVEFVLLGLITAVFAIVMGTLASFALVTFIMRIGFVFTPDAVLVALGLALLATITIGMTSSWQALGAKPARVLKEL